MAKNNKSNLNFDNLQTNNDLSSLALKFNSLSSAMKISGLKLESVPLIRLTEIDDKSIPVQENDYTVQVNHLNDKSSIGVTTDFISMNFPHSSDKEVLYSKRIHKINDTNSNLDKFSKIEAVINPNNNLQFQPKKFSFNLPEITTEFTESNQKNIKPETSFFDRKNKKSSIFRNFILGSSALALLGLGGYQVNEYLHNKKQELTELTSSSDDLTEAEKELTNQVFEEEIDITKNNDVAESTELPFKNLTEENLKINSSKSKKSQDFQTVKMNNLKTLKSKNNWSKQIPQEINVNRTESPVIAEVNTFRVDNYPLKISEIESEDLFLSSDQEFQSQFNPYKKSELENYKSSMTETLDQAYELKKDLQNE